MPLTDKQRADLIKHYGGNKMTEYSCCDPYEGHIDDVDSICPDCERPLDSEGDPVHGCPYSPVCCDTCGYQGCDGSC
jgi:hypothetical protein